MIYADILAQVERYVYEKAQAWSAELRTVKRGIPFVIEEKQTPALFINADYSGLELRSTDRNRVSFTLELALYLPTRARTAKHKEIDKEREILSDVLSGLSAEIEKLIVSFAYCSLNIERGIKIERGQAADIDFYRVLLEMSAKVVR